jgi:peptidyl-dipeptidase Dcp
VFDESGARIGVFIADLYARDSKDNGGWTADLVEQSRLCDTTPVVVVNFSLHRAPAGDPTLLSPEQVRVLFHEFGHVWHHLASKVVYPAFAGPRVPRDVSEFPGILNERWALSPEVLANYARHCLTGEPLPAGYADRLRADQARDQGFATSEYVAAARLDLAWHTLQHGDVVGSVEDFERGALPRTAHGTPEVAARFGSSYFGHIFDGPYPATFYAYLLGPLLAAGAFEWIERNGGLCRETGAAVWALLAKGGSVDSMDAYRDAFGEEPPIDALLRVRGLIP